MLKLARPSSSSTPCANAPDHFRAGLAQHSHRVLALDFIARMHHAVGQAAVIGKQEQAAGIEVQPPDGNPASALQPGQLGKNAGATRRIVPGNDLALRLVINQHARQAQLNLSCTSLPLTRILSSGPTR
jgi:hypothetical protein